MMCSEGYAVWGVLRIFPDIPFFPRGHCVRWKSRSLDFIEEGVEVQQGELVQCHPAVSAEAGLETGRAGRGARALRHVAALCSKGRRHSILRGDVRWLQEGPGARHVAVPVRV